MSSASSSDFIFPTVAPTHSDITWVLDSSGKEEMVSDIELLRPPGSEPTLAEFDETVSAQHSRSSFGTEALVTALYKNLELEQLQQESQDGKLLERYRTLEKKSEELGEQKDRLTKENHRLRTLIGQRLGHPLEETPERTISPIISENHTPKRSSMRKCCCVVTLVALSVLGALYGIYSQLSPSSSQSYSETFPIFIPISPLQATLLHGSSTHCLFSKNLLKN